MRRVQVTHRFDRSVFVRTTAIPKEEQLTAKEAEEGLLPKEPLRAGERVLLAGTVELKAALQDLESRPEKPATEKPQLALDSRSQPEPKEAEKVARSKTVVAPVPGSRPDNKSKAVKG
jgi:cobalt-zinc-cadmium efflux system membrane fusion protein